jgi:pimeloyl-ACP methyl ester carboxylesterase
VASTAQRDVTTPDSRTLEVFDAGVPDGPALVVHHGTPSVGRLFRSEVEAAERLGVRLVSYTRPGYARSTPHPGRSVADAAADVAAILDAVGVERFATYGVSGGGPHALACAAMLPERCAAVATIAGAGPFDAPDLDFLAGMGQGNIDEFGAARRGRGPLAAVLERERAALLAVSAEDLREAMAPHLSDVDREVLTGEFAAFLHGELVEGLAGGVDGWVDDDLALIGPWGFDVAALRMPALVWQGEQDLMVPGDHGRWLGAHVAGAEHRTFPEEGHLTLAVNRVGDVQAWLRDRLAS